MNVVLLEEVLDHLNNWFVRDSSVFSNVQIASDGLPQEIGEYVSGKTFYEMRGTYNNDGLHKVDEDELVEEDAERVVVSLLSIPKPLLLIVDEIDEWNKKYGTVAENPFFSEEFSDYKYTIRGYSSYGAASSTASGWRLAFANRLNPFRKMYR